MTASANPAHAETDPPPLLSCSPCSITAFNQGHIFCRSGGGFWPVSFPHTFLSRVRALRQSTPLLFFFFFFFTSPTSLISPSPLIFVALFASPSIQPFHSQSKSEPRTVSRGERKEKKRLTRLQGLCSVTHILFVWVQGPINIAVLRASGIRLAAMREWQRSQV